MNAYLGKIEWSQEAKSQLELIFENDFTLQEKVFRVHIKGKGCDGFTYQLGFDHPRQEDLLTHCGKVPVHLDPFSAFYIKNAKIDYMFHPSKEEDGFQITNLDEHLYRGKFFKDSPLVPDLDS